MKARRMILVLTMASLPVAAAVSPAGAAQPTRGCPPAFQGPWTFQQVLDAFPPPPEIPIEDILAAFDAYDANDDGHLCVIGLPTGAINVVDNVSNVP
jgi:hypothetical protein